MELGMGMESGPLHSCQVLIRERSGGQIRSSEEPWKGRKRLERLSQPKPTQDNFPKARVALPGRSWVETRWSRLQFLEKSLGQNRDGRKAGE